MKIISNKYFLQNFCGFSKTRDQDSLQWHQQVSFHYSEGACHGQSEFWLAKVNFGFSVSDSKQVKNIFDCKRYVFKGSMVLRYWNWYWYCKMLHHDIEIDIGIAKSFEGVLKLILISRNALGDYWNWYWYCKMLWRAIEIVIDIAKSSSKYWCLFNIKKISIAHPWRALHRVL